MIPTSLLDIAAGVGGGTLTAREVVADSLARIAADTTNAFVASDGDRALADAESIDAAIARGAPAGPLAGVPVGVKDTEDVIGYRTTFGSRLWADAPLASRDSVLVARLRAAGCVVVAKTNTPELAAKGTTDNRLFGTTVNPVDPTRTAGGSSGGAAAAVATGAVPLATASDGGGSIRIPAAACGVPGFKPSLGRIPDGGPLPVDWLDLTSRGVITRTVDELIAVLDVVVGAEPSDLRSLPTPPEVWSASIARQPLPRRVGWSPTLGYASNDPEIESICREAVERLAADGVEIVEIPTVFDRDPALTWITLVGSYLRRTIGDRDRSVMDPEVAVYLSYADTVTVTQLLDAEDECHRLNLQLLDAFARCDLLLMPTLTAAPPPLGQDDTAFVRATYPFNLTRSPAGTIPVGTSTAGFSVNLQIVGQQHADVEVLHLMRHLER